MYLVPQLCTETLRSCLYVAQFRSYFGDLSPHCQLFLHCLRHSGGFGSTDSRRFSWAIILTKLLQYSIFFSDGRLRHLAFVLGSHSWCKSWLSKAGSLSKGLVTLKTWMPCCPSLVCLYAVSLEGSHRKPPVELQKRSCPYSGHWS